MNILNFDYLRDGGTCKIKTSEGIFCFDYRIGSATKGKLYNGLPKDDNSNIIPDSEDLEIRIIEALKKHRDSVYKQKIDWLISKKTRKTDMETTPQYPIGGYAPGNYTCNCITCRTQFQGDKRACQCEPCAVMSVRANRDRKFGFAKLRAERIVKETIFGMEKLHGWDKVAQFDSKHEDELWGNVFAKIKQYGLNNEVLTILKQNYNISEKKA